PRRKSLAVGAECHGSDVTVRVVLHRRRHHVRKSLPRSDVVERDPQSFANARCLLLLPLLSGCPRQCPAVGGQRGGQNGAGAETGPELVADNPAVSSCPSCEVPQANPCPRRLLRKVHHVGGTQRLAVLRERQGGRLENPADVPLVFGLPQAIALLPGGNVPE